MLEQIMVELQPAIINAIVVITGILLAFLVQKVRQYLDTKIEKDTQEKIIKAIEWAVNAVEEIASASEVIIKGKEKYEKAVQMITNELKVYGIELTEEDLNMMIHAVLHRARKEWEREE